MIYVISDLHFCHSQPFIYEPRGFKNENEMNEAIIKNWNSIVDYNDDVYVLGDLMLCNTDEGIKCLKQLKGKIHIIRGNHDSDARKERYEECCNVIEVCDGKFLHAEDYHFFLSHYPCLCGNFDNEKPLKRQYINLCGHTHTNNPFADFDKGLIYHCDADAHDCKPISLLEIIDAIFLQRAKNK